MDIVMERGHAALVGIEEAVASVKSDSLRSAWEPA